MEIDGIVQVSVDDHAVELPHVFEGGLPAKYADLASRFVDADNAERHATRSVDLAPSR
jgi:hypothetical protein